MTLPVLIIGAGGHAGVVLDVLLSLGERVIGFADRDSALVGKVVQGLPVVGDDDAVLQRHQPGEVVLANGIGGTRDTAARRAAYERYAARGYRFLTLVHPSAVVSPRAAADTGAQVMAGSVLQPGALIGANTLVNTRASVDHDCRIGAHVHIAPGAVLSGGVIVDEGAHLGAGCVVLQGVRIGAGALVAAGAVVLRDVPPDGRVAGVPAKDLRR